MFSAQQLRQILRPQMSIALQHLQCLVAGNGRHLHGVQAFLEQAAIPIGGHVSAPDFRQGQLADGVRFDRTDSV